MPQMLQSVMYDAPDGLAYETDSLDAAVSAFLRGYPVYGPRGQFVTFRGLKDFMGGGAQLSNWGSEQCATN